MNRCLAITPSQVQQELSLRLENPYWEPKLPGTQIGKSDQQHTGPSLDKKNSEIPTSIIICPTKETDAVRKQECDLSLSEENELDYGNGDSYTKKEKRATAACYGIIDLERDKHRRRPLVR